MTRTYLAPQANISPPFTEIESDRNTLYNKRGDFNGNHISLSDSDVSKCSTQPTLFKKLLLITAFSTNYLKTWWWRDNGRNMYPGKIHTVSISSEHYYTIIALVVSSHVHFRGTKKAVACFNVVGLYIWRRAERRQSHFSPLWWSAGLKGPKALIFAALV